MSSVDDAVGGLGASLADPAIVHPTYRITLLAFLADSEVSRVIENTRCGCVGFGVGSSGRKIVSVNPGRDGRVWSVPVDLRDKDADYAFCPFDPNELVEKVAIVHTRPSSENRFVSRSSS